MNRQTKKFKANVRRAKKGTFGARNRALKFRNAVPLSRDEELRKVEEFIARKGVTKLSVGTGVVGTNKYTALPRGKGYTMAE